MRLLIKDKDGKLYGVEVNAVEEVEDFSLRSNDGTSKTYKFKSGCSVVRFNTTSDDEILIFDMVGSSGDIHKLIRDGYLDLGLGYSDVIYYPDADCEEDITILEKYSDTIVTDSLNDN